MIPLVEINHFAQKFQVAAETIEKDYVISWILLCLSKSTIKNNFIFYGGTAIKRIYFEEHRFSEDIDLLSTHAFTLSHILQELSCLEYAHEKANLLLEVNKNNIIATNDHAQLFINYLGYDEIIGAPKEIRLDFAMERQPNGTIADKAMIETYSDLKNLSIHLNVMSLNTILANKLGLLIDLTRNEPRDLFDIWFLLNRLDKFDYNFNQVGEAFKERFSFYPTLAVLVPRLNNPSMRKNWTTRLSKQVAQLPHFDLVVDDISSKLQKIFTNT